MFIFPTLRVVDLLWDVPVLESTFILFLAFGLDWFVYSCA